MTKHIPRHSGVGARQVLPPAKARKPRRRRPLLGVPYVNPDRDRSLAGKARIRARKAARR